jgi:hypothetical protein
VTQPARSLRVAGKTAPHHIVGERNRDKRVVTHWRGICGLPMCLSHVTRGRDERIRERDHLDEPVKLASKVTL